MEHNDERAGEKNWIDEAESVMYTLSIHRVYVSYCVDYIKIGMSHNDFVICEVCGKQFCSITFSHLKSHNLTTTDYAGLSKCRVLL